MINMEKSALTAIAMSLLGCGGPMDATDADNSDSPTQEDSASVVLRADDGCQVADAWVAAHDIDTLSRSYEQLAMLPAVYRRSIFNGVTSQRRAEIVLMSIEHYVGAHPELSAEERAILAEAPDVLNAEAYSGGRTARVDDYEARALAVFGPVRLQTEVFRLLRDPSPTEVRLPANPPPCNCNMTANDCLLEGGACKYGEIPCDRTPRGCGRVWLEDCNGICTRQ